MADPSFITSLVIAVIGAIGATTVVFWGASQSYFRGKRFERLILREITEIAPYPTTFQPNLMWHDHIRKNFVHHKVFDDVTTNRDFVLSLQPDLVYNVSQLWDAIENSRVQPDTAKDNQKQWLYYLSEILKYAEEKKLSNRDKIKHVFEKWCILIEQHNVEELRKYLKNRNDIGIDVQLQSYRDDVEGYYFLIPTNKHPLQIRTHFVIKRGSKEDLFVLTDRDVEEIYRKIHKPKDTETVLFRIEEDSQDVSKSILKYDFPQFRTKGYDLLEVRDFEMDERRVSAEV